MESLSNHCRVVPLARTTRRFYERLSCCCDVTTAASKSSSRRFRSETTSIPREASVATDDPVARDDNTDRVPAVCKPYGRDGEAIAEQFRKLSAGARLSIRDCLQQAPHRLLEDRSAQRDRQVEVNPLAPKILIELRADNVEARRCPWGERPSL